MKKSRSKKNRASPKRTNGNSNAFQPDNPGVSTRRISSSPSKAEVLDIVNYIEEGIRTVLPNYKSDDEFVLPKGSRDKQPAKQSDTWARSLLKFGYPDNPECWEPSSENNDHQPQARKEHVASAQAESAVQNEFPKPQWGFHNYQNVNVLNQHTPVDEELHIDIRTEDTPEYSGGSNASNVPALKISKKKPERRVRPKILSIAKIPGPFGKMDLCPIYDDYTTSYKTDCEVSPRPICNATAALGFDKKGKPKTNKSPGSYLMSNCPNCDPFFNGPSTNFNKFGDGFFNYPEDSASSSSAQGVKYCNDRSSTKFNKKNSKTSDNSCKYDEACALNSSTTTFDEANRMSAETSEFLEELRKRMDAYIASIDPGDPDFLSKPFLFCNYCFKKNQPLSVYTSHDFSKIIKNKNCLYFSSKKKP